MSAQNAKSLSVSRLISLLRSTGKQTFRNTEIAALESALKDDVHRHSWLSGLLTAVVNNSQFVSAEDWKLYKSSLESGTQLDISNVNNEIEFLNNKLRLLRKQKEWLQKRVLFIHNEMENEKESIKLTIVELKLKKALQAFQESIREEISFENPEEIFQLMVKRLNSNFEGISEKQLEHFLDELSLRSDCDKQALITNFYEKYSQQLSIIKDELLKVHKECKKVLNFYKNIAKAELNWRKQMNVFIDEVKNSSCVNAEDVIRLQHRDLQSSTAKYDALQKVEIPNHIVNDEFDELLRQLKEKIVLFQ